MYVGSSDGTVTYWHWIGGEERYGGVLKGHKMAVMCLAVAGNIVVSGSADQTLCVWRRDEAEHVGLSVLSGHTGPVKCVAMDEERSCPVRGAIGGSCCTAEASTGPSRCGGCRTRTRTSRRL